MKDKVKTNEVYLKDKIVPKKKDISYNRGKSYGIDNMIFNFTSDIVKEPYGDVAFTTGYDNNPEYTSTFLMTAQEALELGKMLIETASEAINAKLVLQEAEMCDARLSFLVLKGLADTIRINRTDEVLENYEHPYYKYIVSAFKDKEKILSYAVVYNLSYFTSEKAIDYWKDKLTDKGRVALYFDNWNPYTEMEERKAKAHKEAMESIAKMNLKPSPIKK